MTIIDTHSCTVPGLGVGAFHKHDMHGINQRRAVEKLRELARKAICARLILAAGDDPLWPITDTGSIDRRLLDDTFRDRCRESLHRASKKLGLGIFRVPE